MLIRFSVKNYRSIRDRQDFSLVASTLKDRDPDQIELGSLGVRILRTAAIYGANASGKTNVLRAIAYMANAVLQSQRTWPPSGPIPVEPFLLDRQQAVSPSEFEIDIFIDGTRFNYGFEISAQEVLSEWLLAYPRGKKQTWFIRSSKEEQEFRFGKSLGGENRSIQNLTRRNSLFLSAAAQNGHPQLLPIFNWFDKTLDVINPAKRGALQFSAVRMCETEAGRRTLLQFLKSADLGIVDVDIEERDVGEKFQSALRVFLKTVTDLDPPTFDSTKIPEIHLRHRAANDESVALDFEDESDGTRTLFALATPVFNALATGGVLCVDELDASLHPILALQIVKAFVDPRVNTKNAQLIFNTHDTNLLDADLLRRDQIWFTEKEPRGSTQLYPLSDYKPRRGENLERGYLQGRYGGIPIPERLLSSHGE